MVFMIVSCVNNNEPKKKKRYTNFLSFVLFYVRGTCFLNTTTHFPCFYFIFDLALQKKRKSKSVKYIKIIFIIINT